MRTALMIVMLITLLIVAYLTVQNITSRGDRAVNLKTVERARVVRDRAEEAGRQIEKKLEDVLKE